LAACSTARRRRRASSARRRRTCSAASSSPAGRSRTRRSPSSPEASADGSHSRSSSPPARTFFSSTSRRTISTSRAARRSSWRSRRSRERFCSSPTLAHSWTRSPSEREQVESEIAAREQAVAELEQRLADDWADADTLAAHRAARDELQALLARWEQLFDQAQA